MNILDQKDHIKSGRQVLLISATIILLDQCATPFDQWKLLGITINITTEELVALLEKLMIIVLFVFSFRVAQGNVLGSYSTIRSRLISEAASHKDAFAKFFPRLEKLSSGEKLHPILEQANNEADALIAKSRFRAGIEYLLNLSLEVLLPWAAATSATFAREYWGGMVCSA